MKSMATQLLAGTAPALLLAGCLMGPNYQKPEVSAPTQFRGQASVAEAGSVADLPWWGVFQDTALQSLIQEGLANNQDLKVAVARIEQARALVGVAQSEGRPQIGYQAFAGTQQSFVPERTGVGTIQYGAIGGLLNAAWELDVWGRIRRSTEAAQANLLEQEDVRRGVMLTLVTDIAGGYFHLLELDRELAIAEQSSSIYGQTLNLFTERFQAGRDNKLPVERTQAAFDASTAQIQDLKRAIAQQENALSILAGGYPRAIPRGRPLIEQGMPQAPVGATTALLQRRPDILAAEQEMVRANAQVGVAIANYFPRIGLSALVGGVDSYLHDNWSGFGVWSLALNAAGPIYSGGRLKSEEQNRRAYWDETVARYRKTVLTAFQETSDALAAQATLAERKTALESQVAALQRSSDLALDRYHAGRASYFEVLEAQQQLFPAQDALAQTERDQLLAVVSLYKALGGGWNMSPEQWSNPAAKPAAAGGGVP